MFTKFTIILLGLLSINTYAVFQSSQTELNHSDVSSKININELKALSHDQVYLSSLIISKKNGLRIHSKQPFTGEAVGFYPSGVMSTSQVFLKGKRSGTLKKWFPNGLLSFESNYSSGRLHGESKSWWQNGKLRSQSFYVKGKAEGISKEWYSSGEKFKKMNYVAGNEVGIQQAWRKTGELYINYEYINGRIFGLKRANMCYGLEDEKVSDSKG